MVSNDGTTLAETLDNVGDPPLDGANGGEPSPARTRRRMLAAVAALLVVALVGASAALLVHVLTGPDTDTTRTEVTDTTRTEVTDTARDFAVAMSSFDFENLDANRDTIVAGSTPAFAGKYGEMVDALRQIVTDGQGRATATVRHIGVESVDDDRAVVLVFVDQQTTNVASPDGATQKYRMVVTLVRDGDHWLVDDVDTT